MNVKNFFSFVLLAGVILICQNCYATTAITGDADMQGAWVSVPGPEGRMCDHTMEGTCLYTVNYDIGETHYIATYDPSLQTAYDDISGVGVLYNPSTNSSYVSIVTKNSTLVVSCSSKTSLINYILAK